MITRFHIANFKSFREATLDLGWFNVLLGANASGKSNLLEAFQVLSGLGRGMRIQDVITHRRRGIFEDGWAGIRGGWEHVFHRSGEAPAESCIIEVFGAASMMKLQYHLKFLRNNQLNGEKPLTASLQIGQPSLPSGAWPRPRGLAKDPPSDEGLTNLFCSEQRGDYGIIFSGSAYEAKWEELPEHQRRAWQLFQAVNSIGFFDPLPAILREYGEVLPVPCMGPLGENFATVVRTILENDRNGQDYVSWLRELTPLELNAVEIMKGAEGEPLFAFRHEGDLKSARILSDGTLKFAALTALLFAPQPPQLVLLEDIESGLHPSRLRILVQMLRTLSEEKGIQVVATTHSPAVLAWLTGDDLRHVFLCRRVADQDCTEVLRIADNPHWLDMARRGTLARFFVEGGMEEP